MDGLEVQQGTSDYYAGLKHKLRTYCLAPSHSSTCFTPFPLTVESGSLPGTARQHRAVYVP